MNPSLNEILGNRHYVFLIALFLAFINPIVIFWMGTSSTFTFAVLSTFLVWIYMKWEQFVRIESKGSLLEILLGLVLIIGNLSRNFFNMGSISFGIFDMLVTLVGLYIIFFGVGVTRFFIPLLLYALVLIAGYQLEFATEQVNALQNFLAQLMNSLLRSLNIDSSTYGNIVNLTNRFGETYDLEIDGPCTGIKGMLAYGSLAVLLVIDIDSPIRKKVIATAIGLIGTLLVNLLRLSVIFLAIYFLGIDVGMFIHTYLGYGLFIIWVVLFWSAAFKYLMPDVATKGELTNGHKS